MCIAAMGLLALGGVRRAIRAGRFREAPAEMLERPIVQGPVETPGLVTEEPAQPAYDVVARPPVIVTSTDRSVIWEAEWANVIRGTFECLPAQDAGGGMAVWAMEGTGRNNGSTALDPYRHRIRGLGVMHCWATCRTA